MYDQMYAYRLASQVLTCRTVFPNRFCFKAHEYLLHANDTDGTALAILIDKINKINCQYFHLNKLQCI